MEDFKKSIGAGLAIALGGFIFVCMKGGLAGAILFSTGLLTVCIFGLNLYTGKICYFFDRGGAIPQDILPKVAWYLMVLIGNLIAAAGIGFAARLTISNPETIEYLSTLAENKLSKTPLQIFISSIFCDVFIYLAVHTWKKYTGSMLGALLIVFAVAGFILTGSEHCIADGFYFAASHSGVTRILPFMGLCILGNTTGGILSHWLIP